MNATTETYRVVKSEDAEDRLYPWVVLDAAGDYDDQFETKAEAYRHCRERNAESEAEAQDERLADLRNEIEALLPDCEDEDLLERVRAMLGGWGVPRR